MKLELSKAECEAVASYIWNHSRGSPEGRAYKVWLKIWAFINEEKDENNIAISTTGQPSLYDSAGAENPLDKGAAI